MGIPQGTCLRVDGTQPALLEKGRGKKGAESWQFLTSLLESLPGWDPALPLGGPGHIPWPLGALPPYLGLITVTTSRGCCELMCDRAENSTW